MSTNELTAEQVREAIFSGSSYASYDGAKYYADGIWMQAIADELNAKLDMRADDYRQAAEYWRRMYEEAFAERTCRNLSKDFAVFHCSVCGYFERDCACARYCPNCGSRVVE